MTNEQRRKIENAVNETIAELCGLALIGMIVFLIVQIAPSLRMTVKDNTLRSGCERQ